MRSKRTYIIACVLCPLVALLGFLTLDVTWSEDIEAIQQAR